MRAVSESGGTAKRRGQAKTGDACAQCGTPVEETSVLHCGDCQFVYCVDHADGDAHLCAVVCLECVEVDASH